MSKNLIEQFHRDTTNDDDDQYEDLEDDIDRVMCHKLIRRHNTINGSRAATNNSNRSMGITNKKNVSNGKNKKVQLKKLKTTKPKRRHGHSCRCAGPNNKTNSIFVQPATYDECISEKQDKDDDVQNQDDNVLQYHSEDWEEIACMFYEQYNHALPQQYESWNSIITKWAKKFKPGKWIKLEYHDTQLQETKKFQFRDTTGKAPFAVFRLLSRQRQGGNIFGGLPTPIPFDVQTALLDASGRAGLESEIKDYYGTIRLDMGELFDFRNVSYETFHLLLTACPGFADVGDSYGHTPLHSIFYRSCCDELYFESNSSVFTKPTIDIWKKTVLLLDTERRGQVANMVLARYDSPLWVLRAAAAVGFSIDQKKVLSSTFLHDHDNGEDVDTNGDNNKVWMDDASFTWDDHHHQRVFSLHDNDNADHSYYFSTGKKFSPVGLEIIIDNDNTESVDVDSWDLVSQYYPTYFAATAASGPFEDTWNMQDPRYTIRNFVRRALPNILANAGNLLSSETIIQQEYESNDDDNSDGSYKVAEEGYLLHAVIQDELPYSVVESVMQAAPEILSCHEKTTGLLPFQLAALSYSKNLTQQDCGDGASSVDMSFMLLRADPSVISDCCCSPTATKSVNKGCAFEQDIGALNTRAWQPGDRRLRW